MHEHRNPTGHLYVLAGIRWGYSASGHTELTGEDTLLEALQRIKLENEIVFPSLAYAYHGDLRLNDDIPPSIPAVVFVNLSLPGKDVRYELEYVKRRLPCAAFVLYASDADFRRCMKQVRREEAESFQHYFMLKKPSSAPTSSSDFDTSIRKILDEAKALTIRRMERYPRFHSAFISYSHQDKDFARWIEKSLRDYGISCWLDEKQLNAGDRFHTKIEQAIRDREKILLCASQNSLTSWWVDNEINSVLSKEQRLWKERGKESLVLMPLNLDGYLFSGKWTSGWKNQIVSRLAPDFTGWSERIAVDAAPTFKKRMTLLKRLGEESFRRQNANLESVRKALLVDVGDEQREQ